MEDSKPTLHRPSEPRDHEFRTAELMAYLQRPTVYRLFQSWIVDISILCDQIADEKISEGQFFKALEVCRERLKFYSREGELSRDIDRLTQVLAGIEPREPTAEAAGDEEDDWGPESDPGTEFANTNSNS